MSALADVVRGTLDLGAVPMTPRALDALLLRGVDHVVHCGELTVHALHPDEAVRGLTRDDQAVDDVFTDSGPLPEARPAHKAFAGLADLGQRRAFIRAVRAVEAGIGDGRRVAVLGQPAVAQAIGFATVARLAGDYDQAIALWGQAFPTPPSAAAAAAASWVLTLADP